MTLEFDVTSQLASFSYQAAFNADREIVVLFGHSGAGKSLTLQFVAGLLRPSTGRIAIDGACVFDSSRSLNVAPQHRRAGYVVQELALFEHMTVAENVAFGVPRGVDRRQRVRELLSFFELDGFGERRPRTLSGGQRQRVAMGRAIVRDPQVFLFDEPLSNLDAKLRVQMRTEIKELHQRLKTTSIYVTHDQIEAMTMADKIVVMRDGIVEQTGGPLELYDRPVNTFVAGFIGSPAMNLLPGTVRRNGNVLTVAFAGGGALALADGLPVAD
ncbi:MAG: ATP-binding cassette domain-containing protein, partial [Dehalococcoidia bacterium]|nr:ATP-binding cassette domain-containing protein [Dehalococcoidia bacterium]